MRGDEDIVITTSKPRTVVFAGGKQLDALEFPIHIERVPFARPGIYEYRLVANYAHLEEGGTALLRVLPG